MLGKLGIKRTDLLSTNVDLYVADKRKLTILGVVPVVITAKKAFSMETVQTHEFMYVVEELRATFISKEKLQAMGAISEEFPQVSAHEESKLVSRLTDQQQAVLETIQRLGEQSELAPCGCSARVSAPPPPALPFQAMDFNREGLKEYLLSYHKASTFNVCPHQPLPLMQGPPLEFKLKPNAKPFAVYSPATVSAHWEKKVKGGT